MRGTGSLLCFLLLLCSSWAGLPIITPFTQCGNSCELENYLSPNPHIELFLTGDHVVYKSWDEGSDWDPLVPGCTNMLQFPSDPNSILFLIGSSTQFYATTDGGETVSTGQFPISFTNVFLNGQKAGWILLAACGSTATCTTQYSKNFGQTWTAGPSYFSRYNIGSNLAWGVSSLQPDTIFGIKSDNTFGYTTNYGPSWQALLSNVAGFVVTNNFFFVGVMSGSQGINLYASSDSYDPTHTTANKYLEADFPFGYTLPGVSIPNDQGYTFLDDSSISEFLAVKRYNTGNWGTLYTSDVGGKLYTLSLNFVAQNSLIYDFDKIQGLNGIYIANAYPNTTSTNKITMITFDNGAIWSRLAAPTLDINGNASECFISANCSLNLHGLLSYYSGLHAPYYSSPNAIGLIVGVGNAGPYLIDKNDSFVYTYISRDAGLTWKILFNAPTIYDFGDHGGILVFARTDIPTNNVYYSTDEGLTREEFYFTSNADVYVENIISEPMGTGRKFTIIGHNATTHYDLIIRLDFSQLPLPLCAEDQYEAWSPSNGFNSGKTKCFMGATTVYKRRKQDAECYNDEDTDHVLNVTSCACSYADYECDMGFTPTVRNPTDLSFTCSRDTTEDQPSCTSGYRLVPGTNCTGGITFTQICTEPTVKPKSGSGSGSYAGIIVALVIIFAVVGGAGVAYWKHEGFRGFILSRLGRSSMGYSKVTINEDPLDHEDN